MSGILRVTRAQETAKRPKSLGVGSQTIVVQSLKGRATPGGQSSLQRQLPLFTNFFMMHSLLIIKTPTPPEGLAKHFEKCIILLDHLIRLMYS